MNIEKDTVSTCAECCSLRGRYYGALVGVLMLVGFTAAAATASPEQRTPRRVALAQLKAAIIAKNIFHPARTPPPNIHPSSGQPEKLPPREPVLRMLKRPFTVKAFDRVGNVDRVHLHFENPPLDREVKLGETIEFVTIIEINPPYIRCDYDGREVRIDVGEGSDDALARLMGLGSDYHLIATTVTPTGRSARFHFPNEQRWYEVEQGDVLGNARVISIEHGRVRLQDKDGTEFTVRTGTVTRP